MKRKISNNRDCSAAVIRQVMRQHGRDRIWTNILQSSLNRTIKCYCLDDQSKTDAMIEEIKQKLQQGNHHWVDIRQTPMPKHDYATAGAVIVEIEPVELMFRRHRRPARLSWHKRVGK